MLARIKNSVETKLSCDIIFISAEFISFEINMIKSNTIFSLSSLERK